MNKKIFFRASLWLPPLLWMALIFHFSSGSVPVASTVYWQDFTVKKTGHMLLFGALAILLYRAFVGEGMDRKKAAIWAIILSTFYGGTDEFHQLFTQGREARVRDVLIDGIGASVFTFLIYYILPKKILPKMPKEVVELARKFQLI